jgi:hypothetical protein
MLNRFISLFNKLEDKNDIEANLEENNNQQIENENETEKTKIDIIVEMIFKKIQ